MRLNLQKRIKNSKRDHRRFYLSTFSMDYEACPRARRNLPRNAVTEFSWVKAFSALKSIFPSADHGISDITQVLERVIQSF